MQFCFILLQFHFGFAFPCLLLAVASRRLHARLVREMSNLESSLRFEFPSLRLEYLMRASFTSFRVHCLDTDSRLFPLTRKLELETHNGRGADDKYPKTYCFRLNLD